MLFEEVCFEFEELLIDVEYIEIVLDKCYLCEFYLFERVLDDIFDG